jgi:CHAD domain-containing protein
MTRKRHQFHDPVETAYREYSPRLFAAAAAACKRLENPADDEALHDFRVAVRRLRTHIEAHRAQLTKRRAEKILQELRDLVSATNALRDLEVQRDWLERLARRKSTPKLQREGLGLTLKDMRNPDTVAAAAPAPPALRQIARQFVRIGRDFKVEPGAKPTSGKSVYRGERLSAVTGRAILKHAVALRRHLSKLRTLDDVKATHRSRLAVKRLRYLIEPLVKLVPGTPKIVRDLKRMQDRLGDLRDLQILETHIIVKVGEAAGRWSQRLVAIGAEDARVAAITRGSAESRACYALAAGMQRVRREERREFHGLERRWLRGSADALIDRIEILAGRL